MSGRLPQQTGYKYPVLITCIAEGRAPHRQELKRVAARIRDEAFGRAEPNQQLTIATYRKIWRAAHGAVHGSAM